MAEQNPPSWMENGSHSSKNDRNLMAALVSKGGIILSGDMAATFPGGMVTRISAGDAFIPGSAARQGMYHVWNDANVDLTHVLGESNPRKDIIVAQLHDNFIDSGGLNTWTLTIVKGTAGASPSPPATPSNSLLLWTIDIPASATNLASVGVLHDARSQASALGGAVIVPNTVARSALSGLDPGQLVLDRASKQLTFWDGSTFEPAGAGGRFQITYNAGGATDTGANTQWPNGLYGNVAVPDWATRVFLFCALEQIYPIAANCNTSLHLQLGSILVKSKRVRWNIEPTYAYNFTNVAAANASDLATCIALANALKLIVDAIGNEIEGNTVDAINYRGVSTSSKQDLVMLGDVDCSSVAGTTQLVQLISNNLASGALRADIESTNVITGFFY